MLLPDTRALPYVDDLRWLGKIRGSARARYRDQSLDISDCGAKVRKLIEEVVVAEGIQLLVKEVSIFSTDAQLSAAGWFTAAFALPVLALLLTRWVWRRTLGRTRAPPKRGS